MKITIDPIAERRIWAFIRAKSVEVGGVGYATKEEDGTIHWTDTDLIPQEVSASEVDFESTHGDQVAVERAIEDGVLEDPNFIWVSWHSHHTMNAYWSSTDDKRIAAMNAVGVKRLLSFVGCHDGTYEMRFDVFDFTAHGVYVPHLTMSKLSLECEAYEPDEFDQQIAAELKDNVKTKKYKGTYYPSPTSSSTNGKESREEEERRIVSELIKDEGYSEKSARELLAAFGTADCELLLEGGFMKGERSFNAF